MPKGYEKMRDKFIKEGMSPAAAKAKAARIWNEKHPDNPVGKHSHEEFISEPFVTQRKDEE